MPGKYRGHINSPTETEQSAWPLGPGRSYRGLKTPQAPLVLHDLSKKGDVCSTLHAPGIHFYVLPPTVNTRAAKTGPLEGCAQESASVVTASLGSMDMLNSIVRGVMKRKTIVAAATPKRGWKAELATILATHNWRHAAKPKGVSHKTAKERMSYLYGWFTRMWRDPTRPLKVMPSRVREKHLRFEIERWKQERLAPATVQTYHSFLRTFCCWIEKPNLLKPLQAYFEDPAPLSTSLRGIS